MDAEDEEAFISRTHAYVSRKEIKCWPIKIGWCAVNRGRGRISIIQMCFSRILSLLLWALRSPHRMWDVWYFFLFPFSLIPKDRDEQISRRRPLRVTDSWMTCNQIETALMPDNVFKNLVIVTSRSSSFSSFFRDNRRETLFCANGFVKHPDLFHITEVFQFLPIRFFHYVKIPLRM